MSMSITVQMRDPNQAGENYGYTHQAAVMDWYTTEDMLVVVGAETPGASLTPLAAYPMMNVERILIRAADATRVH